MNVDHDLDQRSSSFVRFQQSTEIFPADAHAVEMELRTPSNRVDFSHHSPQSMRDVTNNNFGLLIAYVLPGLTLLWGASHFSDTLRSWLSSNPTEVPTVGGFLYVTLGSVAAGMTVSTIRWLFIDGLHHLTGLKEPRWDFSQLASKVEAFDVLVRIHYHFYQFNGVRPVNRTDDSATIRPVEKLNLSRAGVDPSRNVLSFGGFCCGGSRQRSM